MTEQTEPWRSDPLSAFVEDVAHFWEAQGLPRIAGRIIGLLLVCDPPHRSARELADELGASKASVSAMTRLLLTSGTIEVVPLPGQRAKYFRLTPDSLRRKLVRRVREMVAFRRLADRGLELLEDAPASQRARLEAMRDLYAFLERELPALIERWQEEQGRDV